MSEEYVVEQCSPTLAGIKTGNLFKVALSEGENLEPEICRMNRQLVRKGLRMVPLKKTKTYALIYIYRPKLLKRDLQDPKAVFILHKKAYDSHTPEECVSELAKRMKREEEFPHEVGLFLGYPPSDVEMFMENPWKDVKYCGCWKAYSDPEGAKCAFRRYRKCTEVYCDLFKKGKSLAQLAVRIA